MSGCRIGLAVGTDEVRIVVLRRETLVYASEVPRTPGAGMSDILREMLLEAPLPRWLRPALGVAVGGMDARVKRLTGLPPLEDMELLAGVVRERREAFFLGQPDSILTTGVLPDGPTAAWGAALPAGLVAEVRDGARTLGLRLVAVAPVAAILPLVLPGPAVRWADGNLTLSLEWSAAGWRSVRCHAAELGEPPGTTEVPGPLRALGERGARFADALGASRLIGTEALCVGPDGHPFRASRAARRRLAPPALVAALATAVVALSPVGDELRAGRAQKELAALEGSPRWEVTAEAYAQLGLVTTMLTEVETFRSERHLRTPFLGALAVGLPDGSVIHRLEMDDTVATLGSYTNTTAGVVAAFRAAAGVATVDIVGPQLRAAVGVGEMDAVTLRVGLGQTGGSGGTGSLTRPAR